MKTENVHRNFASIDEIDRLVGSDDLNLLRRFTRKYFFTVRDAARREEVFRRVAGALRILADRVPEIWHKEVFGSRGVGPRPTPIEWEELRQLIDRRTAIQSAIAAGLPGLNNPELHAAEMADRLRRDHFPYDHEK